jgi:hypothetical protein
MSITPTIADEPAGPVRFYCSECHRWAQFQRDRLIARHGASVVLPELLRLVQPCDRPNDVHNRCRLAYWDRMAEENRAAARAKGGMPKGW